MAKSLEAYEAEIAALEKERDAISASLNKLRREHNLAQSAATCYTKTEADFYTRASLEEKKEYDKILLEDHADAFLPENVEKLKQLLQRIRRPVVEKVVGVLYLTCISLKYPTPESLISIVEPLLSRNDEKGVRRYMGSPSIGLGINNYELSPEERKLLELYRLVINKPITVIGSN